MANRVSRLCFVTILLALPMNLVGQRTPDPEEFYNEALATLRADPAKALSLFDRSMRSAKAQKNLAVYGMSVNQIYRLAIRHKADLDSAAAWTIQALSVLKSGRRDTVLARLYYNAADFANNYKYEIDLPVIYYKQALSIWTSINGRSSKEAAACYHGLGDVYKYNKFDFHQAEESYETALSIREKIGFRDTLILYYNYYSLAATNRSQNDYEKALSYATVAIAMCKGLTLGAQERTHGMVANIYRDMEEFDNAKHYYQSALQITEQTKNLDDRAWLYQNFAESLRNAGDFRGSLDYFQRSKALYDRMKVRDERNYISMLIQVTSIYSMIGDDKNFRKAIGEVFKAINWNHHAQSREVAEIYLLMAGHFGLHDSYDSALYYCQKSINAGITGFTSSDPYVNPTEEMIGFDFYVGSILSKKALIFRDLYGETHDKKYLVANLECLTLAEKLLSKQRNLMDTDDAKWTFLDANFNLYENIISSLYQYTSVKPSDSLNKQIFHFFEKSKARSLADALSQAEQTRKIGTGDSLLRMHSGLKAEVLNLESQIVDLRRGRHNLSRIDTLRNSIASIDRQIQRYKIAIEGKYPGYFDARYVDKVPDLVAIQNIMKRRHQVILEFFWGSESVYGLAIDGNRVSFVKIGRPSALGKHVEAMLQHVNGDVSTTSIDAFNNFCVNASTLYDSLVSPFASMIKPDGKIHIIPDGALSQLAFDILLEKKITLNHVDYRGLPYLLKNHSIGYSYSSAMLIPRNERVVRNPSLLAIAFTGGARFRGREPDIEKLEQIEGSEKELEALSNRFDNGKFLVEKEATESNFKSLSPNYDLIHLAIHGKGNAKTDFSASLYFRSKYDTIDDGEFHSYELYGLKLKALMAVLSACESGLGKDYKGEGMISMASAFTSAGCENTLMSLWKVNDQASTVLMDKFYENLLEGEDIAEALRQAKLNYLFSSDELTADPRIWAPLVGYGSLHQIFKKDKSSLYLALAGVAAFIAISFMIWRSRLKTNG
ncbi:MAG: CHAT domain-containing tetratricopeptide repeat protein [Chryseolinea sp.]